MATERTYIFSASLDCKNFFRFCVSRYGSFRGVLKWTLSMFLHLDIVFWEKKKSHQMESSGRRWVGRRNFPTSPLQDRTWTSRFIRPSSSSRYWLCFIQKLLPFPVDFQTKRDDPNPLLYFHYRNFITTTSWSAPVFRIGTLILVVSATWISPVTSERQVPAFPYKSLNQVHVTFTPNTAHPVIRFPMNLSEEMRTAPHFDVNSGIYDASTVLQFHSSPWSSPAHFDMDFSSTLTTMALYHSRLRWFEACS